MNGPLGRIAIPHSDPSYWKDQKICDDLLVYSQFGSGLEPLHKHNFYLMLYAVYVTAFGPLSSENVSKFMWQYELAVVVEWLA